MDLRTIVIAHNIRSSHNVGSIFRTCEGLGVNKLYLTGYTPYPKMANDSRLPHIIARVDKEITKTALGAQNLLSWQQATDILSLINNLRKKDYTVAGLEQTKNSIEIDTYSRPKKLTLILGNEVSGIEPEILSSTDINIEIPMRGQKESFNVVQAAAMSLYVLTASNDKINE